MPADLYSLDNSWKPSFPVGSHMFSAVGVYKDQLFVTQRGNASIPPVLVASVKDGEMVTSWGEHDVALANPGGTWGAHGLSIEACLDECAQGDPLPFVRVWIEDFTNHTVSAYSSRGKRYIQLGTPGVAGNSTSPAQFDKVADAHVVGGSKSQPTLVYASDGDGGYANRVVKIRVPRHSEPVTDWATDHVFSNPHSITLHTESQILIVADREQWALKLLRAQNGEVLGPWECPGLAFGPGHGVPFGVRTLTIGGMDLLFVASMDNPQDHKHQKITIIDASELSVETGTHSRCPILQTLAIDPNEYSGPHLLGVDEVSGDLYVALVADAPRSTVLRFRRNMQK